MSQQPPYGSNEPQQPYQPYTPYSQGAYPNPYQAYPQRRDNTTRNVLLIIGGVILVLCGGLFAFFIWGVSNIDDSFESDYPGSENDPITVEEGAAFEIRGFDYEEGWSVASVGAEDPLGDGIVGLRATNNRDDEDTETPRATFAFIRDNEVLGEITCNANASVRFERAVRLDCYGSEVPPGPYDQIEVYDTSFYE